MSPLHESAVRRSLPVLFAVMAYAYGFLTWVGIKLIPPDGISALWPAAGLSAVMMLWCPTWKRRLVLIAALVFGYCVATQLGTGGLPSSEFVYLAGNIAEPLLVLPFLKVAVQPSGRLSTFKGLLWLLAGTSTAAALAGALVTAGLFAVGADWAGATSWLGWLSGDALGLMLVAPFLLQARPPQRLWSAGGAAEQIALWTALAVALGMLTYTHSMSGLIVLTLLLFALRLDASAASLAALITAVVIIEHALGHGFFVDVGGTGRLDVRVLLIVVSLSVQLAALSTQDRRDALEEAREAHRDMEQAHALLNAVLASAPMGVALYDVSRPADGGRVLFTNRFMNEFGASAGSVRADGLVGKELGEFYPALLETGLYDQLLKAWAEQTQLEFIVDSETSASGWTGVYANQVVPIGTDQVLVTWSDITSITRAHQATHEARVRAEELELVLRRALDSGMDAFAIYEQAEDGAWFASYVNPVGADRSGASPDDLLGAPPELVIPVEAVEQVIPLMRKAHFTGEVQRIRADLTGSKSGWRGDFDVLVTPTSDNRLIVTWRDVSEIQEAQRSLRSAHASAMHAATHDPLTGIPNRVLLLDRIGTAIAHLRRRAGQLGVVFLDLDNFKVINDRHGHAVGDAILKTVATRIATLVRDGDTVARIGGDEFVLLLTDLSDDWDPVGFQQRLLAVFAAPMAVDGHTILVSASIGLVTSEDPAEEPEALLAMADLAMYQSKRDGKGRMTEYDIALQHHSLPGRPRTSDLPRALRQGEIVPWFQPICDARSGDITGYEALARWEHRDLGLIPPGQFLDVFESAGMMPEFGRYMLSAALRTIATQEPGLSVAVNVAATDLAQRGFRQQVLQACSQAEVAPARLVLELTEAQMLDATPEMLRSLAELREHGVQIAIDDFGSGFSSFAYLQTFSFDILKLDKALIEHGLNDRTNAILRSLVSMAHALEVVTLAEGIETLEQLEVVRSARVDLVQGYLLGRPQPQPAVLPAVRL